ncbi:MAG: sugar ABC transporter permease, partial [Ktedonobacteraceae bacterium]|nr:sugar ABC transporter permease [Ktedonobacteraceae bacterium]
YITSSVAVAIIWMWLMNGNFGLINVLLRTWFHVQGPRWLADSHLVIPSISIVTVWSGLGFNMILFLAGLQNIPQVYTEAATVDGANRWQIFWRVTLPLLSPTIFLVLVLSIISSFQVFDQVYVLTGGGPAKASYMIVFHIYNLAFQQFQFGAASAAAVILFAIVLLITLMQFWLQRRWVHYEA